MHRVIDNSLIENLELGSGVRWVSTYLKGSRRGFGGCTLLFNDRFLLELRRRVDETHYQILYKFLINCERSVSTRIKGK